MLLGGITHQAMSVVWPSREAKTELSARFVRSIGSVYANANIVLYLVTATLGGIIYPVYRVWVRTFLEDARLNSAVGSFELKEQFIAIGLGMLPLYWLLWHGRRKPTAQTARMAVTLMLCFIVWYRLPRRPRPQQHQGLVRAMSTGKSVSSLCCRLRRDLSAGG